MGLVHYGICTTGLLIHTKTQSCRILQAKAIDLQEAWFVAGLGSTHAVSVTNVTLATRTLATAVQVRNAVFVALVTIAALPVTLTLKALGHACDTCTSLKREDIIIKLLTRFVMYTLFSFAKMRHELKIIRRAPAATLEHCAKFWTDRVSYLDTIEAEPDCWLQSVHWGWVTHICVGKIK